jgi:hypothetical protein
VSKELLVTCLLCGRSGFSARGLRAHHCRANNREPLSDHQREHAILAAEYGIWATRVYAGQNPPSVCYSSRDQVCTVGVSNIAVLKLIIADARTKPTARKAAESRLRRLEKEAA